MAAITRDRQYVFICHKPPQTPPPSFPTPHPQLRIVRCVKLISNVYVFTMWALLAMPKRPNPVSSYEFHNLDKKASWTSWYTEFICPAVEVEKKIFKIKYMLMI